MKYYKRITVIVVTALLLVAALSLLVFGAMGIFYIFTPLNTPAAVAEHFGQEYRNYAKPTQVGVCERQNAPELRTMLLPADASGGSARTRELLALLAEVMESAQPDGAVANELENFRKLAQLHEGERYYDMTVGAKDRTVANVCYNPAQARIALNDRLYTLPEDLNSRLLQHIQETYTVREAATEINEEGAICVTTSA